MDRQTYGMQRIMQPSTDRHIKIQQEMTIKICPMDYETQLHKRLCYCRGTARRATSVSYTHLTLPTNREV